MESTLQSIDPLEKLLVPVPSQLLMSDKLMCHYATYVSSYFEHVVHFKKNSVTSAYASDAAN